MITFNFLGKASLLIIIVYFLSGCATQNISKGASIDDEKGILVTRIHSNVIVTVVVSVDKTEVPIVMLKAHPPEELKVVAINAGDACFDWLERIYSSPNLPNVYFTIKPGTITYVGDLFIDWHGGAINGNAYVTIQDKEAETVHEARIKFPWLFEKFPYRKNLPGIDYKSMEINIKGHIAGIDE
jgi:hypothetical protein